MSKPACSCKHEPIMLVHGGADNVPESMYDPKREGIKRSVNAGYEVLQRGGSCLDAVEAAVRAMEEDEYFNSGRGSMLNEEGEAEMDASIMYGSTLDAGAVAGIKNVAHPISVARLVLERTPHVSLIGEGAMRFAKQQGVPQVSNDSLVTSFGLSELETARKTGYENPSGGTTGAVALDKSGHLAAATSTGGLACKMVGRMGDTPIVGSGTYADDAIGAVSVTGHGESIAKLCVSHTIVKEMEYGKGPSTAIRNTLNLIKEKFNRTAGIICVSKNGEIAFDFSSKTMPWAYRKGGELHYGLEHEEHRTEIVSD